MEEVRIRHELKISKLYSEPLARILEHLRYSGAAVLDWREDEEFIIVDCLYVGPEKRWEQAVVPRAKSIGCEIEET